MAQGAGQLTGVAVPRWQPVLPEQSDSDLPAMPTRGERFYGLRGLGEVVVLLVMAMVIALALRTYIGQAFVIPSGSMRPQLVEGDRVLVSKLSYRFHDINRGDVIVFETFGDAKPPPDRSFPVIRWSKQALEALGLRKPPNDDFIKRVIGLPGDVVEGRGGKVFIDGKRLAEPYLPEGTYTTDFGPWVVPDDHVFVLGDNRGNSSDSRVNGFVRDDRIVGRAIMRAWPPPRWAFM